MDRLQYPHRVRHRENHQRHIQEGGRLLREFETLSEGHARKMYDWWKGWSVAHVVAEDLELGAFLRAARVKEP